MASWHLHLLNHNQVRKLGGILCGFKKTNKKQDACAGKESLNAKVMGEFRGLEAGQQKPLPEAAGALKAKADVERGPLLLHEVLRGMAVLSHPRNNTHLHHPPLHPIIKKHSVSAR